MDRHRSSRQDQAPRIPLLLAGSQCYRRMSTTRYCKQHAIVNLFRNTNQNNMIFITGMMPRIDKLPVLKFTHNPKIIIFAPQGRLVAPIHVKFVLPKFHVGLLGHTKFHVNRFTGWEHGPRKMTNFHFFIKSRRSEHFDLFLQFLGTFMCPIPLRMCFKYDVICFTDYGVIAEKPRVGHLPRLFPYTL